MTNVFNLKPGVSVKNVFKLKPGVYDFGETVTLDEIDFRLRPRDYAIIRFHPEVCTSWNDLMRGLNSVFSLDPQLLGVSTISTTAVTQSLIGALLSHDATRILLIFDSISTMQRTRSSEFRQVTFILDGVVDAVQDPGPFDKAKRVVCILL